MIQTYQEKAGGYDENSEISLTYLDIYIKFVAETGIVREKKETGFYRNYHSQSLIVYIKT